MVYISIGKVCDAKYQIDEHKHKMKTLFFDRLVTSMNSVIEILSCDDINNILYFDNIIRNTANPFNDKNSRINIKSLDCCVSIHDVPRDFTVNDIFTFIDKYKRRFIRTIEYIKTDEKIYFIRTGAIDDAEREQFIETILKINPKCNFALIVIDNNKENSCENEILKYEHCLHIKLNIVAPITRDWTLTYLNWEKIFLDIENNI